MHEHHRKRKNSLSLKNNSKSICFFVPVQNRCQSAEGAGNYRWEQGGLQ